MSVTTRFAPSPTGYLHIGGVRTALYCWLYAKNKQGKFILRIEDTDRERSTQESVDAILQGMAWLGLTADEGPFYQTQRFDRYKEVIEKLLAEGNAYRCYCSRERLDDLRKQQQENKQKPRYDGCCRELTEHPSDESSVIRFKNPQQGEVLINDLILGDVTVSNAELDDLIIARSDGTPTYNLTVVVDDWDMEMTHVIRGNDHLNNTPRQINLLKALGAEIPQYAHIPMILGEDGKRLSKRHGAVSVLQFRELGILPEALLNYLVRLGWSHGDKEIFSLEEMIELFDLSGVNKAPAAFDKTKLLWVNQHYLKTVPIEELIEELTWHLEQLDIDHQQGPTLEAVIEIQRERAKTLREMAENSRCFYQTVEAYDTDAVDKHIKAETLPAINALREQLATIDDWSKENISVVIKQTVKQHELKFPQIAQPLRIAMTGNTVSPSIDATLALLGQETALKRLDNLLNYLEK